MDTAPGLATILDSLKQSLSSALEVTPKLADVKVPKNGLSLLQVKNDLLLSYLRNLVFLLLLKLRDLRNDNHLKQISAPAIKDLVVNQLVELRLYLERGVRPLEDKLRYQLEKVLRAAEDAERGSSARENGYEVKNAEGRNQEELSASESGSGDDDGDGLDENPAPQMPNFADLQYRPNLSAFVRSGDSVGPSSSSKSQDKSGVYRPPKVAPITMPTTERRERTERRPQKSATLDEFLATELSSAPIAEPSIGTTIMGGGRRNKTWTERREDAERREYEEQHFVRLPKESKKERARKERIAGRTGRMNFGGEDWRDLSEGVDRINKLTKNKGSGTGTRALLEKSRKRNLDTIDGPRGSGMSSGVEVGERFQKRLKIQEGGRRDRGKRH